MKLTKKQGLDLESIIYFIPEQMKDIYISEEDIEKFFEYSDQGKHKEYVKSLSPQWERTWFWALLQWKRWRGIHIRMYEEWVLDWSMPYSALLNDYPPPRSVVDFLKKEMFQWHDAEKIERIYTSNMKFADEQIKKALRESWNDQLRMINKYTLPSKTVRFLVWMGILVAILFSFAYHLLVR